MAEYEGDVVFREGVHYPIRDDEADLSRPLRRNAANTGWRDAEDGEPLHNDTFHQSAVELAVGGEG
jgi:hypothetical protein